MGRLFRQEIYLRMNGGAGGNCEVDSGLQALCLWSKDAINGEIAAREAALRQAEEASLLAMRKAKCEEAGRREEQNTGVIAGIESMVRMVIMVVNGYQYWQIDGYTTTPTTTTTTTTILTIGIASFCYHFPFHSVMSTHHLSCQTVRSATARIFAPRSPGKRTLRRTPSTCCPSPRSAARCTAAAMR